MPDQLASQVAAGEVVDRPASVIKELVENSLDAGASRIDIATEKGGVALMRITDDGTGMDRDDALLSLERHATSKIRQVADLDAIMTLGFRGEALASIASVSRFRLCTRERDALAGTEIEVAGGKLVDVRDWGGAPGTSIEVRSLFFNMPGRRKFLRAERTEASHVEQQLWAQAIGNPAVAFTYRPGGASRGGFQLPATTSLRERVRGLVGTDLSERLLEVPLLERGDGLKIAGFIAPPGTGRGDRSLRYVFLNGRPVDSPVIAQAMREGYAGALGKGRHPVTFLFLEMPPSEVDVNVHPAKREVKFRDGIGVRRALATAIADTLRSQSDSAEGQLSEESAPSAMTGVAAKAHSAHSAQSMPQVPIVAKVPQPASAAELPGTERQEAEAAGSTSSGMRGERAEKFVQLGNLGVRYSLFESEEGLVILDRRAAHQRVLYEGILDGASDVGVSSQGLLNPLTWEVAPTDADLLRGNLDILARLGIGLEEFGPHTFKVDALPGFLKTDDGVAILDAVLGELSSLAGGKSARLGLEQAAAAACRLSVQRGEGTRSEEVRALLEQLFQCDMPYTCPKGKPTLIQLSNAELERKFGG